MKEWMEVNKAHVSRGIYQCYIYFRAFLKVDSKHKLWTKLNSFSCVSMVNVFS